MTHSIMSYRAIPLQLLYMHMHTHSCTLSCQQCTLHIACVLPFLWGPHFSFLFCRAFTNWEWPVYPSICFWVTKFSICEWLLAYKNTSIKPRKPTALTRCVQCVLLVNCDSRCSQTAQMPSQETVLLKFELNLKLCVTQQ